ncbi:LLM class flavin-dependent oxidoreductase [Asaia astilbis]|uniref:LLM class flavin-dependent oxidoreductase n=1 Tax=Asaia astilbis TaxID=610244 RepID=UPI0004716A20|nr:LLM class flavin-dependent oxidoreductase [Asaia astilbis]
MSVEFIGFVGNRNFSETIAPSGASFDPGYVEAAAKIHESAGFDRALFALHSDSPDSFTVAAHAAAIAPKLGLLIAHRPGFIAPTLAARQFATLDHLSDGRVAPHIITGASDVEFQADGDYTTKAERYARTKEYLDIVRLEWESRQPFDYEGKFYRVNGARSQILPKRESGIPIYFGGSSAEAIAVAGKHADVYALWGESYAQVAQTIANVRAAAAPHGRSPRFSLSLRPIIADTEEAAWAKADDILARAQSLLARTGYGPDDQIHSEGSRRLLAAAGSDHRADKRLWTGIAALTGAKGNTTSLVGTPDQVADALLDYHCLGISTFLIRGFDPLPDALAYGTDLLPRVRELIAQDERRQASELSSKAA